MRTFYSFAPLGVLATLLCLWLATPTALHAQCRLGSTEAEIRNEFPYFTFYTGTSNSGQRYIYTDQIPFFDKVVYYFSGGDCEFCAYLFNSRTQLARYVEYLESIAVRRSDTHWVVYDDNGNAIHLRLENINGVNYIRVTEF